MAYIGEELGQHVSWDEANETVIIKDLGQNTDGEVPEAVFKQFKLHFTNPDFVKREKVQMIKLKMRGQDHSQIGVYTNLDHLNGGFSLFDWEEGEYKEVYSVQAPVYSVESMGDLLVITTGFGGTGIQENKTAVVKYIEDKGYRDVWSGDALNVSFGGPPPYYLENGSISLNMRGDELLYSKTKRIYNGYEVLEDKNMKPDQTLNMIEIYRYNEETNMFELTVE